MQTTQFQKIIKNELAKLRTLAIPVGTSEVAYNYSYVQDTERRKILLQQSQKQKGFFSFARSW